MGNRAISAAISKDFKMDTDYDFKLSRIDDTAVEHSLWIRVTYFDPGQRQTCVDPGYAAEIEAEARDSDGNSVELDEDELTEVLELRCAA